MARIVEFHEVTAETNRIHDGVECGYRMFSESGVRVLQLDTYGSSHRAKPGKVSQSIQLDEEGAEQLARIIFRAFPGLRRRLC